MRLKKDNLTVASTSTSSRENPELESTSLSPVAQWLRAALQDAEALYRAEKYTAAADHFSTALQDCSNGAVLAKDLDARNPVNVNFEDISKVLGFIESRLAACYLKIEKPDLALPHSYRSIRHNPIHFRSHLQQSMVYGSLGNPCMAVRSAMIADYMHWLGKGSDPSVSARIKLHWQEMLVEATHRQTDISFLYTPCFGTPTRRDIQAAEQTLRERAPKFTTYVYTDPDGGHRLPKTTDWSKSNSTTYILTVGFRREQDGMFLTKLLHKNSHLCTGPQYVFRTCMSQAPDNPNDMCETFEKRILPVLDFINCTKLAAGFSTGSGVIERLQYGDCLYQLGRKEEHEQVLEQTLTELAIAPYLQDVSPPDIRLLQTLTGDVTNTLAGRKTDQKHVWSGVKQQVGSTEGMSASSEPLMGMLRTNSQEISQQRLSPAVSPVCSWKPQFCGHMHPHPQQCIAPHPHPQQPTTMHPHPQQCIATHPHPQQPTTMHPHPQQCIATHPHTQQPMAMHPCPQHPMGMHPHPQRPRGMPPYPQRPRGMPPYPQQSGRQTNLQQYFGQSLKMVPTRKLHTLLSVS